MVKGLNKSNATSGRGKNSARARKAQHKAVSKIPQTTSSRGVSGNNARETLASVRKRVTTNYRISDSNPL